MPDRPYERLEPQRRVSDKALTLSYKVNQFTGITPEDVAFISEWLELASTEEGQRILRQRRRDEQAAERARRAKDDRRRNRQHAIFDRTIELMEGLYPGQDYFNLEVAQLSQHKEGLTAENLGYAMKRHSIRADPEELSGKLRVRGYHFKTARPDDIDTDF